MKNFLLVVLAVGLTLAGLELFFRVFPSEQVTVNNPYRFTTVKGKRLFLRPFRSYQEIYPLRFDLRGYYEKSQGIIDYSTNQYGARWMSAREQPLHNETVVVLGDSFTYGFGLRYEDAYPFQLERLLSANGQPISFLNMAVPAANVQTMLAFYSGYRDRVPHAGLLYGLHLNDLISFPTSYVLTHSNTALGKITNKLGKVSQLFAFIGWRIHNSVERSRNIRKLLSPSKLQSTYFQRNLSALVGLRELAEEEGLWFRVALLPLLVDLKQPTLEPLYSRIRAQLDEHHIPYVDLTRCLDTYDDHDVWILPFDQHPNEIANRVFAQELFKVYK